ncbi:MAG: ComEC/Rec2 family competence protein [Paracoccaceae bacterium]
MTNEPLLDALARQRGHLLCWVPVFLAIGIGGYFALPVEPTIRQYAALSALAGGLWLTGRRAGENLRPLLSALVLVVLGVLLAGARGNLVGEAVLGYRYYGPVQGRIVMIDRSASGAVRLTLDRVVLRNMAPAKTPARIRVSLQGQQGYIDPAPGLTVILTGSLAPPGGPVEPGGFDFQRIAWFDRLGAVGYTRTPVLAIRAPERGGIALRVFRARMRISAWVQANMPGRAGAFATAVMTGDRSAMQPGDVEALRASNLSHLLAISGLHMGLLTGFVFASLRYLLAAMAWLSLRLPAKKVAAVGALLAGAAYLALSGGNVATERAFVMVAVMFTAVLLDRRAITLRAVAVAAVIVLVLRPEVLPEPGFQMSFAATTALVAVFGALRGWRGVNVPRLARPVLAVVISSAVAGLATAPFAAAHFNRFADYGLLANLLSVPLMGLVVMPGAVLSAVLAPFGLGWIGLAMMKPAIDWILGVANWVAGLDGALSYVPAPPVWVLPLLALGLLWLILWQGGWRARGVGLVPAALAFIIWMNAERPVLLISDTGGLVGVMTPAGRVLNKPRGEGFAARIWLENDGDGAQQAVASGRSGYAGDKGSLQFQVAGKTFVHLYGRGALDRLSVGCAGADFVILAAVLEAGGNYPCRIIDRTALGKLGSVAIFEAADGLRLVGAKEVAGRRLWNSPSVRARAPERN